MPVTGRRNGYAFGDSPDAETGTPWIAGRAPNGLIAPVACHLVRRNGYALASTLVLALWHKYGLATRIRATGRGAYTYTPRRPIRCLAELGTPLSAGRQFTDAETGTLCLVAPGMRLHAEMGTPQKRVRQRTLSPSSPYTQNRVRFCRHRTQKQVRIGIISSGKRLPGVPDSAGISACRAGVSPCRPHVQVRARRNGYGLRAYSCGKACGISDLSPQIPVRGLR